MHSALMGQRDAVSMHLIGQGSGARESIVMNKSCNVQVAIRLNDGSHGHILPASRATLSIVNDKIQLMADGHAEDYEFDHVVDVGSSDELMLSKIESAKLGNLLLAGISVGLIGFGGEGERPGAFLSTFKLMLRRLKTMIDDRQSTDISLSLAIFGVTDTSCIDLIDYSRKDLASVESLQDWIPLRPTKEIDEVISNVEKGYSLPCIMMVRLFAKDHDQPGAMSTLLMADLGSAFNNTSLEKSLTQFRTKINSGSSEESTSFLSCFLGEYFGGLTQTIVLANAPQATNSRSAVSFLTFLETLRQIKNRPTANLETPEMLELAVLLERHAQLENVHQETCQKLRQTQKKMESAESKEKQLLREWERTNANDKIYRLELEYEMLGLTMEKANYFEKIRLLNIDLVRMEYDRLVLGMEMKAKEDMINEIDEKLKTSTSELERNQKEYSEKISGLSTDLGDAQKKVEAMVAERKHLESSLATASQKISTLEIEIVQVQNKLDIRNAEHLKEHTIELKRLSSELQDARSSESKLQGKLATLETLSASNQSKVVDLESQLKGLTLENATLQAQIKFLSQPHSPKVGSKEFKKLQEENNDVRNMMNDLRKLILDQQKTASAATAQVDGTPVKRAENSKPHKASELSVKRPTFTRAKRRLSETSLASVELPAVHEIKRVEPKQPSAKRGRPKKDDINKAGERRDTFAKVLDAKKHATDTKDANVTGRGSVKDPVLNPINDAPLQKGSVKLPPKLRKNNNNIASERPKPMEKILTAPTKVDAPDDVEIPGTPPQSASPVKTWKSSAFIPGITKKGNGGENSKYSFANFTFAARSENGGLGKRIKLPEKPNGNHSLRVGGVTNDASIISNSRKNVDQSILQAFNVPTAK